MGGVANWTINYIAGISGIAVTKGTDVSWEKILKGKHQVVYMSPEMAIGTKKLRLALQNDDFSQRLCGVIIDEAHYVMKWLVFLFSSH